MQSVLKDGRISLYLEYYLGRSETPELDADGNQVYYTDGAMAGKPKYKVKHVRKKENLNYCCPIKLEDGKKAWWTPVATDTRQRPA